MAGGLEDGRRCFADVSASVGDLVESDEVGRMWGGASLVAGFSVGGLAGHLLASSRALEALLDQPVPGAGQLVSPALFYGANKPVGTMPDDPIAQFIVDDGERRAAAGQAAVAASFRAVTDRLLVSLASLPPDRLVPTLRMPDGAARLDDYLATRIVELVVHGDDLALSVGIPWEPPGDAARAACILLLDVARGQSGDLAVVRALARGERADSSTLPVI